MPPKQPDPRDTFRAYLDVQSDYQKESVKALQLAAGDAERAIRDIAGTGISAKIEADRLKYVSKALHERLAELYRKQGNLIEAEREDAAAAASNAFGAYESMLLKTVLKRDAVDAYLSSAELQARSGVEAALARVYGKSYIPLAESVYQAEALSKGWVDRYVEVAMAKGMTARQIAQGVKSMINPNVPGGVSYASMRLGRTEINNAFHATSITRYQDNPFVTGVEWHLSSSHPEGDECDDLAAEGPYDKFKVPRKPHPFCFCFITPELISEDDFLDAAFGPDPKKALPKGVNRRELKRR